MRTPSFQNQELSYINTRTLYICTTLQCNLSCLHCSVSASPDKSDALRVHELKLLIPNSQVFPNISRIDITGGEPFLHPSLCEIVEYIRKLFPKIELSITSNGTIFRKEVISTIEHSVDYINISLDGRQNDHEYLRGQGTFNKTKSNIKKFVSTKMLVRVNTLITKFNYQYLEDFARELSKEIPVYEIRGLPLNTVGRARLNAKQLYIGNNHHNYIQNCDQICDDCLNTSTLSIFPDGKIYRCHTEYSRNLQIDNSYSK